jgi:hypothetical protein
MILIFTIPGSPSVAIVSRYNSVIGSGFMPAIITGFKFALVFLIFVSGPAYAKSASETAKEFYDLLKQKNYSAAAVY